MNYLLEITKDQYSESIIQYGFLETLLFGGKILLIGMLTVFAVLFIIWGALVVFKRVFHDLPASKSPKKIGNEIAAATDDTPYITTDDGEIIAAIAAAIATAESESGGVKFKVVAFRRK